MISPEEKFRFDLQGYLVVKNALAPEEVAEMNRIADEMYTEDYDEKRMRSRQHVSQWGPSRSLTLSGGIPWTEIPYRS